MSGKVVRIDASRIISETSLHDLFAKAFGFPDWYGRNGDAWIDLMTYLDSDKQTTTFFVEEARRSHFSSRTPALSAHDTANCMTI